MARRKLVYIPAVQSAIYLTAAIFAILLFRALIPGGGAQPIEPLRIRWGLLRGFLTVVELFPALVLAALTMPFGLYAREGYPAFVPGNITSLGTQAARAAAAGCVYAAILFLAAPLAEDALQNIESSSQLYRRARTELRAMLFRGGVLSTGQLSGEELSQARHLVNICDNIWAEGREISEERGEVLAEIEERRVRGAPETKINNPAEHAFSGQREPVDAAQALRFANAAMTEKRYYDAHWLAGLAQRLAREGSVEESASARLASQAWASIELIEPTADDVQSHSNYLRKREGYQLMNAGDWIRSYYIFRELRLITPNDKDLDRFIAKCEEGLASIAFFLDEVDMASPLLKHDAVFSMPRIGRGGRVALHAESLALFGDAAFALDVEVLGFDAALRPLFRVSAPYAKIVPFNLEGASRSVIYMRTLDRENSGHRWEPIWENLGAAGRNAQNVLPPEGADSGSAGGGIVVDMAYSDMLLASRLGTENRMRNFSELRSAGQRLGNYGFVPEVFYAEEIRLLAEPLMLLPLSIFAITIGWRYRVRAKRVRYTFLPMLAILPAAFIVLLHVCRRASSAAITWALLTLPASAAHIAAIAAAALLFVVSLIALSFQHNN